jgi:hypothetical protein
MNLATGFLYLKEPAAHLCVSVYTGSVLNLDVSLYKTLCCTSEKRVMAAPVDAHSFVPHLHVSVYKSL